MQYRKFIISLIFLQILLWGCKKDHEMGKDSPTTITSQSEQEIWYLGDTLTMDLKVNSGIPIRQANLRLVSTGDSDWKIDSIINFASKKQVDEQVRLQIPIPDSLDLKEYTLQFEVENENSEKILFERSIRLKNKEFEGLKLFVSFQDDKRIEVREPFNSRLDVLEGSSTHGIFGQNIGLYVSNMVVFSPTDFQTIYTGLDWHINHFHTGPPMLTASTSFNNGNSFYWKSYHGIVFSESDGSILATTAEGVMEGDAPQILKSAAKPHSALVIPMDAYYFALTDISGTDPKSPRDIVKVIDANTGNELFREEGLKGINAATSLREMRDEYAIFGTDKGLLSLIVKNKKVEKKYINYPQDFNGEAVDILVARNGYKKPSHYYAVKKNKGIYQVNPHVEKDNFKLLFESSAIQEVSFNYDQSKWVVLDKNNELSLFVEGNPNAVAKTKLNLSSTATLRILTTNRFVYIAYPGATEILRFDLENLDQHESISIKGKLSDIGIAGNLEGHPINNH